MSDDAVVPVRTGKAGRRTNAVIAIDGPTRQRILDAATALFASKGYHATGVSEIGAAVGLGKGALYHHIQSKEKLLFEISEALVADMVVSARCILELDLPPLAKLYRLADDLLQNLAMHRSRWVVSLYESRALSEPRRQELIRRRDEYEQIWAQVLDDCAAAGLISPVSAVRRRGIVGLLNSTYMWLDPEGPVPIAEVAEQYVDLILNGLRPEPSALLAPGPFAISAGTPRSRC
jgi:AcrR family transcriptional regulator